MFGCSSVFNEVGSNVQTQGCNSRWQCPVKENVILFFPQTDRAVQLLLETSAENPHYYCDSLKACLVTTVTSSGPSQSTIKLVATNMIANGKLAGKYVSKFTDS